MSRPREECLYCLRKVDPDSCLKCSDCSKSVDIKCLKRPGTPGGILGDVFFHFRCSHCTDDGKEVFTRIRLPWAILVVLAIHNLTIQSKGLSHHGYFHWRAHIASYIEKNWTYLIGATVEKKKKWTGTISGTLSHNSPSMFTSGFETFKENGWWKLTLNYTPKQYLDFFRTVRVTEKRKRESEQSANDQSDEDNINVENESNSSLAEPAVFSRSLPFMGCAPRRKQRKITDNTESNLNDFLSSQLSEIGPDLGNLDDASFAALLPSINADNDWPPLNGDASFELSSYDDNNVKQEPDDDDGGGCDDEEIEYKPRIVQVINYQENVDAHREQNCTTIATNNDHCYDLPFDTAFMKIECGDTEIGGGSSSTFADEPADERVEYEKSLFTVSRPRPLPWEVNAQSTSNRMPAFCQTMSLYEENELLTKLTRIMKDSATLPADSIPPWIRRFYRKLSVRAVKRNLGKPIFEIGNDVVDDNDGSKHHRRQQQSKATQILDRFRHLVCTENGTGEATSFYSRLAGCVQYDVFESPHTGRRLHPFIYRSTKTFPPWLKLMCEIQHSVTGVVPGRSTIDYCYVRPVHIAAVNGMLQNQFWSGIDMSECLSYPDFSIVALYKKLVVGCAFLVPDVSHNEAYVSFMAVRPGWQRAGIASFMLYHLTQTCMGRDITLHVSASNAAICLYQKFGFKIEEVILDFYDKYMPIESTQSRHAFFLRLKR